MKVSLDPFIQSQLEYFIEGLDSILSSGNVGRLGAFQNKNFNDKGFLFEKEDFINLLKQKSISISDVTLPQKFLVKIKFSPISLFKKWIFYISNDSLLKISERKDRFEKDFFLYEKGGIYSFFMLTTNIAQERFLYHLYEKEDLKDYQIHFNLAFDENRKLILYKDYLNKKEYGIFLDESIPIRKLQKIEMIIDKDSQGISYTLCTGCLKRSYYFFDLKEDEKKLKKLDELKPVKKKSMKLSNQVLPEKNYVEIDAFLKSFDGINKSTNQFANISLGRINRIPVLINLSNSYKNTLIVIKYHEENRVLNILDQKGSVIKSFLVSKNPKSNWLKRAKK